MKNFVRQFGFAFRPFICCAISLAVLIGCSTESNQIPISENANSVAETEHEPDEIRYDQMTWLCTHNAYNASESGFRYANQNHGIEKQLNDGVRALMLDVWESSEGEIVLRHGDKLTAILGSKPIQGSLKTIRNFLEANPDAIVTLIFESYVAAEAIGECIESAGLDSYCYRHDRDQTWPALSTMRGTNKRLVVFSDRADGGPDWYMPIWNHCHETDWASDTADDLLSNQPGRGDSRNALFIANHFLANPLKSPQVARKVNSENFLVSRFGKNSALDRKPNFIAVDFYAEGDCLQFVESMNEETQ